MTTIADRNTHRPGTIAGNRSVSHSAGKVVLRDPELFGPRALSAARSFLRRVFRLEHVLSVEIDQAHASAVICHANEPGDASWAFLSELAETIRDAHVDDDATELGVLPAGPQHRGRFKVVRQETLLTTWEVVHEIRGRIRFRNDAIRTDPTLPGRLERELAGVLGVTRARVNASASSLLVEHDPATTSRRHLVRILEGVLSGQDLLSIAEPDPPPVRFGLANASVALAVIGQFAFPAVQPITAALLIYANWDNFRAAWNALRQRKLVIPLVSATIVVGTLATGGFLAAALMGWLIKFWQQQYRRRLVETRQRLLPELVQRRRFAWLRSGKAVVEVPVERLQPGDRVVVYAGEVVPVEGRVVAGSAVVDERLIRGVSSHSHKVTGDVLHANSRVVTGDVDLEVSALGATRASQLGKALVAASSAPGVFAICAHAEPFAGRAVVPTLTAAGFGLLVGDATTAVAILRPDYASGPSLGIARELIEDVAASLREGILVRDGLAFTRLTEVDAVLFDVCPALLRKRVEVVVVTFGQENEDLILRMAEAALRDRLDKRTRALKTELEARGLSPIEAPQDPSPSQAGFLYGGRRITVRETSGTQAPLAPLVVEADGRSLARLIFRDSDEDQAVSLFRGLQARGLPPIGLVATGSAAETEALTASWGAQFTLPGIPLQSRAALLKDCRARGFKVAYVGDGCQTPDAVREAHVAISLSGEIDPSRDPSSIVLLRPDLVPLGALWDRAQSHVERVRSVHGSTLVSNLACVAGAFTFGFTSLATVAITNLGTLGVYTRATSKLHFPKVKPDFPAHLANVFAKGLRGGFEDASRQAAR